jgi:hypothetical protein
MPGNLTPNQMFDHKLSVIKGPSPMHRLDYAAAPTSGLDVDEGSIISLNSAGTFVAGCAVGAVFNRPMPMFAIQATNDFDANSDTGNISGGVQSAVVATGGFEIETTEFVSGTYNFNDTLTAATAGNAGMVARNTVGPYGAENVVGVVSAAVATNADGKSVLRFWTMFLPAGDHNIDSSSSNSSSSESSSST